LQFVIKVQKIYLAVFVSFLGYNHSIISNDSQTSPLIFNTSFIINRQIMWYNSSKLISVIRKQKLYNS
jgi:hypothetical protein